MAQLDADQYLRLTPAITYGQDDGLFWDKNNSQLVLVIGDSIIFQVDASGTIDAGALEGDQLVLTNQAQGDLIRYSGSVWERLAAATAGQIVCGDGTDVISAAMSGNATISAAGAVSVVGTSLASQAAGDLIYAASGTTSSRLAKGSTGQVLVQNEGETAPEWRASIPSTKYVHVFEDFVGSFAALDNGSRATDGSEPTGPWVTTQTETTGDAVIHALVADADDGHFKLGFSADSEEQASVLYWGDEANIPGDKDPVVIFRLKIDCAGAAVDAATEIAWGICDAQNNDINAATHQASFSIDGANLTLLVNSDDNSAPDADNDTSVTLVKGTFYEFMIDCADPADVQFKYRATLGGAWTTLLDGTAFPISGAANFQPFVQLHKAADTNEDAVTVDYIEAYWART